MRKDIKNIIFDLGGVILNLDIPATSRAFVALANHHPHKLEGLKTDLTYLKLEVGDCSVKEFCEAVRQYYSVAPMDEQIIAAWNAMVQDIPVERLDFLLALKKKYRTFLFSNTNAIHLEYYNAYLLRNYGMPDLSPCFEKVYYSHLMRLRKPEPASFLYILEDSGLVPEETLFVDDTAENIEAARNLHMQGIQLAPPMKLTDLKGMLL